MIPQNVPASLNSRRSFLALWSTESAARRPAAVACQSCAYSNALRILCSALAALLACAWVRSAHAQQDPPSARKGLYLAARMDCEPAVPLLEQAERERHRAEIALALADCRAATGKLFEARDIYVALTEEKVTTRTRWADRVALTRAKVRLKKIDARIPTLKFSTRETYEKLEVFVNGEAISDPLEPLRYPPGVELHVVARAKGRQEFRVDTVLREHEHVVLPLVLEVLEQPPSAQPKPEPRPKKPKRKAARDHDEGRDWIGARFRGYLVPQPVWRLVGDGGKTFFVPGGSLTYSFDSPSSITMLTLGYSSYMLSETPFKSAGTPDTDYEIVESDLRAVTVTLEYSWREPLNASRSWEVTFGAGIGVGWMFAGDLVRTQAYPPDLIPGDPYSYAKCKGPNNPAGTFRYCNQLDHDADRYDKAESNWFQGGKRPLIYPWLALPQLGFTHHVSRDVAIDMEMGLTISGLLLGMGVRVQP
jgi:hypothetical protein